jgi:hypothetical protein
MGMAELHTYRFECDHPECSRHHMGRRAFIVHEAHSPDHAWSQRPDGWTGLLAESEYNLSIPPYGLLKCETCPEWDASKLP